jgi:hypothetical protein
MNILEYIEQYGNEDFASRPFNNVDSAIMALISYLNFDLFERKDDENYIYFKDIAPALFKDLSKDEFISKENVKLLGLLKASPRYRNLGVGFIRRNTCIKKEEQFFACTIVFPDGTFYIVFRGTDFTMVGWKEDCNMAFSETVPSQKSALEYLKEVTSKLKGKFYIGGHSKGGNLSFYSHLFQEKKTLDRCIAAYSFDGPGFFELKDKFTDTFDEAHKKMIKIIPQNSLVGIMFSSLKDALIVHSTYFGIFQHNPYSWQIDPITLDFFYLKERTRESYINELTFQMWINSLSHEDKIFATEGIFTLMGGTNLTLSEFIKTPLKRLQNFKEVYQNSTPEERTKFTGIFKQLLYYHKQAKKMYAEKEKQTIEPQLAIELKGE